LGQLRRQCLLQGVVKNRIAGSIVQVGNYDDVFVGELGFLRLVNGPEQLFEVRRILKAFVDGQWLADFDGRLTEYAALLSGDDDDA